MALDKQLHTVPNSSQPTLSLLLIHRGLDQITALRKRKKNRDKGATTKSSCSHAVQRGNLHLMNTGAVRQFSLLSAIQPVIISIDKGVKWHRTLGGREGWMGVYGDGSTETRKGKKVRGAWTKQAFAHKKTSCMAKTLTRFINNCNN